MSQRGDQPSIPPLYDRIADASAALTYGTPGALGVGAVLGTVWAPFAGDLALGLIAMGAAGTAAWAYRVRSRLARLPLDGARDMVWLGRSIALQCWLGRGRRVGQLTCTAMLLRADHSTPLQASVAAVPCVGPFLVVVQPPPGGLEDSDRVRVAVEVESAAGALRIERTCEVGELARRYEPPVAIESGRLVFRRHAWGRVQS